MSNKNEKTKIENKTRTGKLYYLELEKLGFMLKKYCFLFIIIFTTASLFGAEPSFSTKVPAVVVKGERFRIEYVLTDQEGRDIQIPEAIKGFDILFGPSVSTMSSTQFINGRASSSYTETYSYTLIAKEEGTFTIPAATIKADNKTLKSSSAQLRVLPPDKNAPKAQTGQQQQATSSSSTMDKIDPSDAFIRAIVSKTKVHEQEAFMVTFRFYTTLNAVGVDKVEFPEFEGFMVEDLPLSDNRQMQLEHYNGRNYYSLDFKKSLLFPQRSGKITIPSGKVDVIFRVKSGKKVQGFFNQFDVMTNTKKAMKTNPLTIDISPLPEGKPNTFANAVGNFNLKASISETDLKANDAITLKLDISGVGNMKLIKTPEFKFPTDFETYDPTITNNLKVTSNGLSGTRTIEYMIIPRHPGNYTIPAASFSFYDPSSKTYKTLSTETYTLKVAKDPNAKLNTGTSYNQSEVKEKQDIRFIKNQTYRYQNVNNTLAGSLAHYLWYIIPLLLLTAIVIASRRHTHLNSDIRLVRTRKANKIALRRLKLAGKFLANNEKEKFYEETLKATWGYLSDKLSIPISNLNRENIESKLIEHEVNEGLVKEFISILDTCEYARYAPAGLDDNKEMDNFYNQALDTIGEMENTIKLK